MAWDGILNIDYKNMIYSNDNNKNNNSKSIVLNNVHFLCNLTPGIVIC